MAGWKAEGHHAAGRVLRALLIVSTVVLAACPPADPGTDFTGFTAVQRDSLVTLGRALAYDTAHGAGDRQRLMRIGWFGRRYYGTDAEVQPADSSFRYLYDSLSTGRIVARVITRGDGGYPKYRLPAMDTTYLWVKRSNADSLAVFVPTDTSKVMGRAPLYMQTTGTHLMGLASWIWDWNDEKVWVTCTNSYCCRVGT